MSGDPGCLWLLHLFSVWNGMAYRNEIDLISPKSLIVTCSHSLRAFLILLKTDDVRIQMSFDPCSRRIAGFGRSPTMLCIDSKAPNLCGFRQCDVERVELKQALFGSDIILQRHSQRLRRGVGVNAFTAFERGDAEIAAQGKPFCETKDLPSG